MATIVVFLITLLGCTEERAQQKRVLFLGDSITHGVPHNYRFVLWKYMIDAGWDVDLVGTVEDWNEYPSYKGQNFDTDHEGHSGWTSNQINSSIKNWVNFYTADVVLYHIGTNDIWKYDVDKSLQKIQETIDQLRADNPRVEIYLSKIIPLGEGNSWVDDVNGYSWLKDFNNRIVQLSEKNSTVNSPVYLVDHNSNFTDEDLVDDKVHPSEKGAIKMAVNWAIALGIYPS